MLAWTARDGDRPRMLGCEQAQLLQEDMQCAPRGQALEYHVPGKDSVTLATAQILMGTLLRVDLALAPGKRASGSPPIISPSCEPEDHPNPGPDPTTPLPLGEPFARGGGQVEQGGSDAQVSQAILHTAFCQHSLAT